MKLAVARGVSRYCRLTGKVWCGYGRRVVFDDRRAQGLFASDRKQSERLTSIYEQSLLFKVLAGTDLRIETQ